MNLKELKSKVAGVIRDQVINSNIMDMFFEECSQKFVPTECEYWDYKESFDPNLAYHMAEAVRDCTAMYNTYGGLIIFGVDDSGNPVGLNDMPFKIETLRDSIKAYTGNIVQVNLFKSSCSSFKNKDFYLINVPKRNQDEPPLVMMKNGPDKNNKPIFRIGNTYFRNCDRSQLVDTGEKLKFIFSARLDPSIKSDIGIKNNSRLPSILPPRECIVPNFIGRKNELEKLWRWLTDVRSRWILLAGDGGKGKSSIAYEFACQVCDNNTATIEFVIWMTAKSQKYNCFKGVTESTLERDFEDYRSLLEQLCTIYGDNDQDILNYEIEEMEVGIRGYLDTIPILLTVDDIDSLDEEDKQRSLNFLISSFGASKSRLIITSRERYDGLIYSALKIEGLNIDDYTLYVEKKLVEYGILTPLNENHIVQMHKITDGSPLYTEDLLQSIGRGVKINKALGIWEQRGGHDARKYALGRELERLTKTNKEILLCAALLKDCSVSEIEVLTGFQTHIVKDSIRDLKSLFLIKGENIICGELRFYVSNNTGKFVIQECCHLERYEYFAKRIKELNSIRGIAENKNVGRILRQAIALIAVRKEEEAEETILRGKELLGEEHPDLCGFLARIYYNNFNPPRIIDAREQFMKSYKLMCKKEELYDHWIQMEISEKQWDFAVDVATKAIHRINKNYKFYEIRADIKHIQAELLIASNIKDKALPILMSSKSDYEVAISYCNSDHYKIIDDKLWSLHNQISEMRMR